MTTIAIIDDDIDVAGATEYFIGAKCHIFSDPKAFLETANLDSYQVVVTDYCMPEMNGCQLAKALREKGFSKLIILISGKDKSDFCCETLKLFDDILAKPPDESASKKLKFLGFCYGGKDV